MIDVKQLAEQAGLKTGENQHFADGHRYRSLGCQNVKESDLEAFAALVLEAAALKFNQPYFEYFGDQIQDTIRAMKPAKEQT